MTTLGPSLITPTPVRWTLLPVGRAVGRRKPKEVLVYGDTDSKMAPSALLLAILHSCGASHELDDRPNILFVLIDDVGFNDLGFSQQLNIGKAATRTPSIDKLARSGLVLGNYYVDTVCSPTRATIMTGRYPIHNTINQWIHSGVGEAVGLPLNETTVADLLNESGYICHAIGKWHLVCGIVVCGMLMVYVHKFVPGC